MKRLAIRFQNAFGLTLSGNLSLPGRGEPRAYAVFAHCFTCSKSIRAANVICQQLAAAGIAALRFDFAGLGQSDGQFGDTSFSTNISDIKAAADFLATHFQAPKLLIGHSLGGAAVLRAALSIDSALAVVSIAAPAEPDHASHLFAEHRAAIEADGQAEVVLAGRPFLIRKSMLDDFSAQPMLQCLPRLKKALLVMHSPIDDTVEVANAQAIYQAAKHPKSFVSLDRADHLLMNPGDAEYAAHLISAWVGRYLGEYQTPTSPMLTEDNTVVASLDANAKLATRINANGFEFIADEPVSVGGADVGPSPYEMLSAALASCTVMTLQMYARLKGIELANVTVATRHSKIHATDSASSEAKPQKIDVFEREIRLPAGLDEATREKLLAIADRCPVHNTLHSEVKIETRLRD